MLIAGVGSLQVIGGVRGTLHYVTGRSLTNTSFLSFSLEGAIDASFFFFSGKLRP